MPHSTGFYQRVFNQAEKILYGAAGTGTGISAGETFRNLSDIYIRGPKVRFEKPGFNLRKWQKYYQNRYNPYKRRIKAEFGDLGIETSNPQQEALRPAFTGNYNGGNTTTRRIGQTGSRFARSSRPSYGRCYSKSDILRILAKKWKYNRKFRTMRRIQNKFRRNKSYSRRNGGFGLMG